MSKEMKINTFLKKLGIAGHPGLRVDPKLEGYQDFTFGCRAGPVEPNVNDLAHELAHAAQFGPRYFKFRAFKHGFQFRMRQVELLGRFYSEPSTPQATTRELDTFAYQAHLLQLAGVKLDLDKHFEEAADILTRFMPDWWAVPGDTSAERKAWCVAQGKRFYERRKPQTVLNRLRGWLDLTAPLIVGSQTTPT